MRSVDQTIPEVLWIDFEEARGIDQDADDDRVPIFRRAIEELPEIDGIEFI